MNSQSARRVSAESTASSSSFSSLESFTTATTTSTAPKCEAPHPFSTLNEAQQHGSIAGLQYVDQGKKLDTFHAYIKATQDGLQLEATGRGRSKAAAKREASSFLCEKMWARREQRVSNLAYHEPSRFYASPRPTQSQSRSAADELHLAASLFTHTGIHLPSTVFASIDLECWDRDQSKVTEVGISWISSRDVFSLAPVIQTRHLIVEEYYHLRNTFVADNKDTFLVGESEFVSVDDLPSHILAQFQDFACSGSVVVGGVGLAGDMRWMRGLGLDLEEEVKLQLLDIGSATQALLQLTDAVGLKRILHHFSLPVLGLHNAGNDAFYSLAAMLRLMVAAAVLLDCHLGVEFP